MFRTLLRSAPAALAAGRVASTCTSRVAGAAAVSAAAAAALAASEPSPAACHCQVPCGIFDDPVRVTLLKEHAATIRKAMAQLGSLTASPISAQSLNQSARWVAVKEDACAQIIAITSEYMLCQRVKKDSFKSTAEYHHALEVHHALMQAAMKAKQTADSATCDVLDHAIEHVGVLYTKHV